MKEKNNKREAEEAKSQHDDDLLRLKDEFLNHQPTKDQTQAHKTKTKPQKAKKIHKIDIISPTQTQNNQKM